MSKAKMEIVGAPGGGNLVQALMANGRMDVNRMRPYIDPKTGKAFVTVFNGGDKKDLKNYKRIQVNAATLRRDEWLELDKVLQTVNRERLTVVDALYQAGLVYNLGNAFGTTVLEHHTMSDALKAQLSMTGVVRGENDTPEFDSVFLPIPIVHADFQINLRTLEASRRLGNPLDTTQVETATRKIKETLEDLLIGSGSAYTYGNGAIYGYLNFPHRVTGTLDSDWINATPAQIVQDVLNMKQASMDHKHYGPWEVLVPGAWALTLDNDYDTTKGITVRERIMKIDGIKNIRVVDRMPGDGAGAGQIVLAQMTSDTVRMVKGMDIQAVEWKSEGNFVTNYKVLSIQVPQLRADYNGNSGIVVFEA